VADAERVGEVTEGSAGLFADPSTFRGGWQLTACSQSLEECLAAVVVQVCFTSSSE
jgi:hypothetical protein